MAFNLFYAGWIDSWQSSTTNAPSFRYQEDTLSSFSFERQWRPRVIDVTTDLILKRIEIAP